MKNTEFLDKIEWLYKHDYERYKLIEFFINSAHDNEKIIVSKQLNIDTPMITIHTDRYIYKHQCRHEEEANKIIDIAIALNKQIEEKQRHFKVV
ncbi:hypothetical protein [Romboutsia ilealis]|uniref:hypothetical protein n=1 Tax=Romboutsia ilealis TaxID=1115758 RepID=UPI00259C7C5B|nr:hypothetical protein [Romboutsia ilealis]